MGTGIGRWRFALLDSLLPTCKASLDSLFNRVRQNVQQALCACITLICRHDKLFSNKILVKGYDSLPPKSQHPPALQFADKHGSNDTRKCKVRLSRSLPSLRLEKDRDFTTSKMATRQLQHCKATYAINAALNRCAGNGRLEAEELESCFIPLETHLKLQACWRVVWSPVHKIDSSLPGDVFSPGLGISTFHALVKTSFRHGVNSLMNM